MAYRAGVDANPNHATGWSHPGGGRGRARVVAVLEDDTTQTLAGTGAAGFNGDGLAPERTQLFDPQAVVVGEDGEILVADRGNARVRAIR